MQLGNCGSPLETDAGWLVITHGVGPMRRYTLGALLLDIDDPSTVIGHLPEPLLAPREDEREGYVPNVVFSCGAVAEPNGTVKIYWGGADKVMCVGTANLEALVNHCIDNPRNPL